MADTTLALAKLQAFLEKQKADAVLITQTESLRYFTGFSGGEAIALFGGDCRVLCTDSRYTTQAKQESPAFSIALTTAAVTPQKILAEVKEKYGISTILYEDRSMTCAVFHAFEKTLSDVSWKPAGNALVKLREVKTQEEFDLLAAAEAIGCHAFSHVLDVLKPGMTELAVAAELEYAMKKEGAENVSFTTIAASGLRSAMPHGAASEKELEKGDFLTMDFGCIYHGYCSDMTRTVVIGQADEKQKEIYDIVLRAQLAGLAAVKKGAVCRDADKAARDVIAQAGYGRYFGHSLGHGVGLAIHEEPCLSPRDESVLVPGMVVTVEPGIYIPEIGGVRIEDMVGVTEDGIRNFADSPKELIEISC